MDEDGKSLEAVKADIYASIDAAMEELRRSRQAVASASNAHWLGIFHTLTRHDAQRIREERDFIR